MKDGSNLDLLPGEGNIYSYSDFEKWYEAYPEQRTEAYRRINQLKNILENSDEDIKDPIEFLHNLYYEKTISLRGLVRHYIVNQLYSFKGFQRLFTESFGWELRLNTERTPAYDEIEAKRVQNILQEVGGKIGSVLNPLDEYSSLSIRQLRGLSTKLEKTLYLFDHLLGISEQRLLEIFQSLGYGPKRATLYMNELLKGIFETNIQTSLDFKDIELNYGLVQRWLDKNKKEL